MKYIFCKIINGIILSAILFVGKSFGQEPASMVDPFIGTGKSVAKTKWGNYGGTYPGAVAPWGMVQLTPETSIRLDDNGYYYEDSVIRYFSCINHKSGFPNGSSGNLYISFASQSDDEKTIFAPRIFEHADELASAGYYSVRFKEGDQVELTATQRTGFFRYTPVEDKYIVAIKDEGNLTSNGKDIIFTSRSNGIFQFSQPWDAIEQNGDVIHLLFSDTGKRQPLLIKMAVSYVSREGSYKNMETENPGWDFEKIKETTYALWNQELNVIDIHDASIREKKIFYTALYHSFLLPWIISDADGSYLGADKKPHQSVGQATYSGFSTWDTFRTLHPLLTLLKPHVQQDMMHSLVDYYRQTGRFPNQPMTGFHFAPLVLDTYAKGITAFNFIELYQAIRDRLEGVNEGDDLHEYLTAGFFPDSVENSVNMTLEYAYNDWTVAEMAQLVNDQDKIRLFNQRAYNYRNLFDPATLYMLPRNNTGFVRNPGEMGYQESNKWTTTFFVPHNIQDLINLMGGDDAFVTHLAKAYEQEYVLHDNEPVFHYPYLFTYAGRPDLTTDKIREILQHNYTVSPGGITGNDDLGSMSSWYIFSSIGLFPVCPGSSSYVLTTPSFKETTIRLSDGKQFHIATQGDNRTQYISSIKKNGKEHNKLFIEHKDIVEGGKLDFILSAQPHKLTTYQRPYSMTKKIPDFQLSDLYIAFSEVMPDQENKFYFTIRNNGVTGTKHISLSTSGKEIARKTLMLSHNESMSDSLSFRLYKEGNNNVQFEEHLLGIHVKESFTDTPYICNHIQTKSVVRSGGELKLEIEYQNISGKVVTRQIPVYLQDSLLLIKELTLMPGECKTIQEVIKLKGAGLKEICTLNKKKLVKLYSNPLESDILSFSFDTPNDSLVQDLSGFNNHGGIVGPIQWQKEKDGFSLQTCERAYLALPTSESLMDTSNTLTLSTWIFPVNPPRGYADFFTKGDYTLLKMENAQTLVFFAGGWGRGACMTEVPDNWYNQWHHIAGVCDGNYLRLYIDGELKQETAVSGTIEYTEVPWNIGRNAEIPYSRFFDGRFDELKIYKEALSPGEIKDLYLRRK